MAKNTKERVSNTKPLTINRFTGDKRPGTEPAIPLYKVEDDYKYDSGNVALIHVKIDKSLMAAKQNTNNQTLPVIK